MSQHSNQDAQSMVSVSDIADHIGGRVQGNEQLKVSGLANLARAQNHQLSFLSNAKYLKDLASSQAGAVILNESAAEQYTGTAIIVSDPYVGFAKAAQYLDTTPAQADGIESNVQIDSNAVIGQNVSIGSGTVIKANAHIGDNCVIGPNCFVGEHAVLGEGVNLRANVCVYHRVELGERVSIHSGTVIGSDGFGYANDRGNWVKIPQLGTVIIGVDTEIGANTAIDRGTLDNTIIARNVIIDNLVHIAHNVEIGDHSCICGSVGIAGSAIIGKYVVIAGQCAINGHIEIADKVQITGQSMVTKSIKESGTYSSGMPAAPNRDWQRNTVQLRQIGKLVDRVKQLEKNAKGN